MRAVIWTAYGPPDVLQFGEVQKPEPDDNEILIKIHATTVTAGDCEARRLQFPLWLRLPMRLYVGVRRPTRIKILGQELAGEVAAVGKHVTRFKVGDAVFGSPGFRMGAYAEYVCLPEQADDSVLALKPVTMSFEEAATVTTGGLEALHFLRMARLQPGERLLINGAGGSIGTYGIQLAKAWGAVVTAVDSPAKLDLLRALGADAVIDYTQTDFTRNGATYDVIFDVVGTSHYGRSVKALAENGRYLIANPTLTKMLRGRWTSRAGSKQVIFQPSDHQTADLVALKELIEAGTLKAVIDRRYPLEEAAEAHRYVEAGHKKGNVVLVVTGPDEG